MNDYEHVFTHTSKTDALQRVEFHMRGDSNLSEMLEAFTQYLKAVGFYVDPTATLDFLDGDEERPEQP